LNAIRDKRRDPRPTEELITLALNEPDDDAAWEPVTVLHARADEEVFDAAERLCGSPVAKERRLGAGILGQLGQPVRVFPSESFDCLARMLAIEDDPEVLESIAEAFGHLEDPRCIALLTPFKSHPDPLVRLGVVHGLSGQDHPAAIDTLIELSGDEDGETRSWATFSLATFTEVDTTAIREALVVRLADPREDARGEALVGLARRKDPRVLDVLLKELTSKNVGMEAIEAAEELCDPRLIPALVDLKNWWPGESRSNAEWLDRVIASCTESAAEHKS
jgi:HEAT repeat protein